MVTSTSGHVLLDLRSINHWPSPSSAHLYISELATSLIHSISHLCSSELTMGTILFLFVSMFIFMRAPPPEETCARSSERYYILPHRVLPTGEPKPNWAVVLPGLAIGWGVPPSPGLLLGGNCPEQLLGALWRPFIYRYCTIYLATVCTAYTTTTTTTTYKNLSLPLSLSLSPGSFSLAMKHVQLP